MQRDNSYYLIMSVHTNAIHTSVDSTDGILSDSFQIIAGAKELYNEVVSENDNLRSQRKKTMRVVAALTSLVVTVLTLLFSLQIVTFEQDLSSQNISSKVYPFSLKQGFNHKHSACFEVCYPADVQRLFAYTSNMSMMNEEHDVNLDLKAPFTMMIVGPTGSGKTVFVLKMMRRAHQITDYPPAEIIVCYSVWQPIYDSMRSISTPVRFHEGVLSSEDLPTDRKHRWIIVDDLMTESTNSSHSKDMANMFTRESHHRNMSVLFVSQNLFPRGGRVLSINSHYIVLFKNPRDSSSIMHLAKQISPGNVSHVVDSYKNATREPYSYLLLDLKQETSDSYRLLGKFREDETHDYAEVYVPTKL